MKWGTMVRFGSRHDMARPLSIYNANRSHDLPFVERPPFDRSTLRSVYHIRNTDVYRMKCLENSEKRLDIMVSHDWPLGIYQHGNVQELLRKKPFFRKEVERNELGSLPNREILDAIKPKRWFSAHLHVKFEATVVHAAIEQPPSVSNPDMGLVPSQVSTNDKPSNDKTSIPLQENDGKKGAEKTDGLGTTVSETTFHGLESSSTCSIPDLSEQMTKFLALDKCLPRRQYLSVVHIPKPSSVEASRLEYDPEWLAIVRKTYHLTSAARKRNGVPSETINLLDDDIDWVVQKFTEENGDLTIPDGCCQTVPIHSHSMFRGELTPFPLMGNPQTDNLLSLLELQHTITIPFDSSQVLCSTTPGAKIIEDENEIDIDSLSDGIDSNSKEQCKPAELYHASAAEDENEINLTSVKDAFPEATMAKSDPKVVDRDNPAPKKRRRDIPNKHEDG